MMLPPAHRLLMAAAIAPATPWHLVLPSGNGGRWIADAFAHPPLRRRSASVQNLTPRYVLPGGGIDDDEEKGGWRAFRARLVRDGLPSLDEPAGINARDGEKVDEGYAHLTTPLVEAGSVLLSVPTTDLCQALDQQYWHRSVVLITEVSRNVVGGDVEDTVPEEQLAHGDNRGRWSYRGLLLNRCTDVLLSGDDNFTSAEEGRGNNAWSVHLGGDLLGLDSSSPTEFACLHRSGASDAASAKLGGGLYYTTLSIAQALCGRQHRNEKYLPDDFMTFGGFCSWRPGQLEREMGAGREEWMVLSVDGRSVWGELQTQRDRCKTLMRSGLNDEHAAHGMIEAGTSMWRNFLGMIGVPEARAVGRLPPGQLGFYDRMLEVWAEDQLARGCNKNESPRDSSMNDSSNDIGPGALLRARSPPTNDMLLYDAEFVRSLVLVLEDTPNETVGIILNRPMAAAIECVDGEDPLPLRYGGPSWRDGSYHEDGNGGDGSDGSGAGAEIYEDFINYRSDAALFEDLTFDDSFTGVDDDPEDGTSFIWIHRNAKLGRSQGGGTKLGTSNLWLIEEDDCLERIRSGALRLDNVMVFSGVSIWEKGPGLGACGGGVREQVDSLRSLEIVRTCDYDGGNSVIERMCDVLTDQDVLTKATLCDSMKVGIDAWSLWSESDSGDGKDAQRDGSRARLADAALKAWLARNLLEDPLNTLVEVPLS